MRLSICASFLAPSFPLSFLLLASSCATGPGGGAEPSLTPETIRLVIRSHFSSISGCYERAIDERPGAEGKVVLEWDIDAAGSVQNPRLAEAGEKIRMAVPCLLDLAQSWRFPKPAPGQGVVAVRYPFYFSENGRTDFGDQSGASPPSGQPLNR
jgi:hypothetical protein